MNKPIIYLVTALCITSSTLMAVAQGCSDAGFCTMSSFKANQTDTLHEHKNQIKAGVGIGSADYSISVFNTYIEYNSALSNKFGVDVKLTTLSQSGNGISAFGVSDVFLNGNYRLSPKTVLTVGAKIPLSNGNKMKDGLALPMDYQSSLGTFDLILGMGFTIKKIELVAALQQPLTQNNNQFIAEQYPIDSPLRNFQSTNNFIRRGDVLLRISYPLGTGRKLMITPSLLPIYHLANDKYTDASGIVQEITGSQGLTLNGTIYFDYRINNRNVLQLNAGTPFIVRDARPDGLTRSFVANLEYRIKF